MTTRLESAVVAMLLLASISVGCDDATITTADGAVVDDAAIDLGAVERDGGNAADADVADASDGATERDASDAQIVDAELTDVSTATDAARACETGAVECLRNRPRRCDERGVWLNGDPCEGATPVCSGAGVCVSVARFGEGNPTEHTCAVLGDGRVRCWGHNDRGQLGLGVPDVPERAETATEVPGLENVRDIALGKSHTCALDETGDVWCWGANDVGQLGNGRMGADEGAPARVAGLGRVRAIGAGWGHSCAVTEPAGAVSCWGDNTFRQAGTELPFTPTPQVVQDLADVVEVAGAEVHTCARRADGAVYCWGSGASGKLGDGMTGGAYTTHLPRRVMLDATTTLDGALEIATGNFHSCARVADGLVCWGGNGERMLADGTTEDAAYGVRSLLAPDVAGLGAGYRQTCANVAGEVLCVGANPHGDLGRGGLGGIFESFAAVLGLDDAAHLSTLFHHSCVVRESGAPQCWGNNAEGQLGDGTSGNRRAVPVNVRF